MVYRCVSSLGISVLSILDSTINAERYVNIFSEAPPCLFHQVNSRQNSAPFATVWLWIKEVCVIDWPACSPDMFPIGKVWCIMKRKILDRDLGLLSNQSHFNKQE